MNARNVINGRASPTYLAKAADPSRRMVGQTTVTTNPLAATTTIYKASQGAFGETTPDGVPLSALGSGLRRTE
jgi:hypothetical protein